MIDIQLPRSCSSPPMAATRFPMTLFTDTLRSLIEQLGIACWWGVSNEGSLTSSNRKYRSNVIVWNITRILTLLSLNIIYQIYFCRIIYKTNLRRKKWKLSQAGLCIGNPVNRLKSMIYGHQFTCCTQITINGSLPWNNK